MKSIYYLLFMTVFAFGCAESPDELHKLRDHKNWIIDKMTITYLTVDSDTNGNETLKSYNQNVFLGGTVSYQDSSFQVYQSISLQDYEGILVIKPTDEYIDPENYNYSQTPITKQAYYLARPVDEYDDYSYRGVEYGMNEFLSGSLDFVVTERPMKNGGVLLMLTKNQTQGGLYATPGPGHIEIELSAQ